MKINKRYFLIFLLGVLGVSFVLSAEESPAASENNGVPNSSDGGGERGDDRHPDDAEKAPEDSTGTATTNEKNNGEKGYNKKNNNNDNGTMDYKTWIPAVASTVLLIGLLFVIAKRHKKYIYKLNDKIDGFASEIYTQLSDIKGIKPQIIPYSSYPDSTELKNVEQALAKIETRLEKVETSIKYSEKRAPEPLPISPPAQAPSTLSHIEAYNAWAANPLSRLPVAFTYLEGDMRMREEQNLKPAANESMWITNKYGSQKYLFPNPNLFDQMTDLKDIYKMDLSKLKAKGQNRIKIIKACEMSDKGFISYGGELELL